MTLALIRHGETDWNRLGRMQGTSDIPLNDTGRAQAREAADLLAGGGWTAIVSSPLARARETAGIIAEALGLELGAAYPELAERDYGPLEGASSEDVIARHPDRVYPGAEPLSSVVARGRAGLARVAADHPDGATIVVAHGTLIRYTLAELARRPIDGIRNGTISLVEPEEDGWRVLSVNGVPLTEAATELDDDSLNA